LAVVKMIYHLHQKSVPFERPSLDCSTRR